MEVEFFNTPEDMVAVNRLYAKRSGYRRRGLYFIGGVAAVIALWFLFNPVENAAEELPGILLAFSIPVAGALIVTCLLIVDVFLGPRLIKRSCRREPVATQLAMNRRLTISDVGITVVTPADSTMVEWPGVTDVVEDVGRIFVLFDSCTNAFVVPVASFRDASQTRGFLETIHRFREQAISAPGISVESTGPRSERAGKEC